MMIQNPAEKTGLKAVRILSPGKEGETDYVRTACPETVPGHKETGYRTLADTPQDGEVSDTIQVNS